MRKRLIAIGGAILYCVLTIKAQQPLTPDGFEFKAGQLVYVIAIKTSEVAWRTQRIREVLYQARLKKAPERSPQDRPLAERETLERSIAEPDTLTSTDLALKNKLEAEFKRQKKFKLAASAETADVVFFAFGKYSSTQFQVRGNSITGSLRSDEASAGEMMTVVALALPASTYRQTKKDSPELSKAARWVGAENGEIVVSKTHLVNEASVEGLVKHFHHDALKK